MIMGRKKSKQKRERTGKRINVLSERILGILLVEKGEFPN
jgi:hypothetical protein